MMEKASVINLDLEILKLILSEYIVMDCYTEHSYGSDIAYIKILLSKEPDKTKYSFEDIESLLRKATDNIPSYAVISSTGISFCEEKDKLCFSIEIRVKESALLDESNVLNFHQIAHSAFNVDMGFIS